MIIFDVRMSHFFGSNSFYFGLTNLHRKWLTKLTNICHFTQNVALLINQFVLIFRCLLSLLSLQTRTNDQTVLSDKRVAQTVFRSLWWFATPVQLFFAHRLRCLKRFKKKKKLFAHPSNRLYLTSPDFLGKDENAICFFFDVEISIGFGYWLNENQYQTSRSDFSTFRLRSASSAKSKWCESKFKFKDTTKQPFGCS